MITVLISDNVWCLATKILNWNDNIAKISFVAMCLKEYILGRQQVWNF